MTSIQPLPIYPDILRGDELLTLKHAKQSLGIEKLVKPVRAVPGSPGPIIAMGEAPHWIVDYANVATPTLESFKCALMFVLENQTNESAVTVCQQLEKIFGEGVKEVV